MFLPFSLILSKSVSNSINGSTHSIPLRSMIIEYSMLTLFVCSKTRTTILWSLIDLGSNHPLTRFHHFITTQIGIASMFQSFVWSMLRSIIRNLWEVEDLNWYNRVWFNVQIRNVLYLIILSIGNDWMETIKWMNWIVLDSLKKTLYWTSMNRVEVNENGFQYLICIVYWMEISITINNNCIENNDILPELRLGTNCSKALYF